jgi:uncharacterized protein YycO
MDYLPGFIDELIKIAEAEKVERAMESSVPSVGALKRRLKPGDVLFTAPRRSQMKSAFGKYVFKPISRLVQRTDYGHSSIYVAKGQVVEARIGEGTITRPISAVAAKNNIVVMRPNVSTAEKRKAVSFAKSQKGTPYDMKALVKTLNPFRGRRKGRKPEEAKSHICSALIANAYSRRKFSDAPRLTTKPVEIMKAPHMKPVTALEKQP